MKAISRKALGFWLLAAGTLVGGGVLLAQGETREHQAQHNQQAQHQEPELEVFCSHLPAGQLCLGGTPTVLKLDGTKKERWIEAGRQYNKVVDTATKQLLAQAKTILSPQEYATVEKWFGSGLNEVLNRVLIGDQATGHSTNHK